ncbi:MAG: PRC-barrel domain-containing protein [Chloroflexi bacterium]|nr:PRC-barrel domain-containing protein [Chloroflexota bacterium]
MTNHATATLSKLSDTNMTVKISDEDIRGRTVKDKDGNDVGKVDDLLIDDRDQKVRFMQVESGGFLGLGETKSFIPVDAITRITKNFVHINQSRAHVAGAPCYDPGLAEQDYYRNLYGYYGYAPYWGG